MKLVCLAFATLDETGRTPVGSDTFSIYGWTATTGENGTSLIIFWTILCVRWSWIFLMLFVKSIQRLIFTNKPFMSHFSICAEPGKAFSSIYDKTQKGLLLTVLSHISFRLFHRLPSFCIWSYHAMNQQTNLPFQVKIWIYCWRNSKKKSFHAVIFSNPYSSLFLYSR